MLRTNLLRIFLAAAFAPVLSSPLSARERMPDPLLGILAVPSVFGRSDPSGPPGASAPAKPAALPVYELPDKKSKRLAKIASAEDAPTREFAYEEPGLEVWGRADGWYKVALRSGYGWISAKQAGTFHAYEDLVQEGLSHLTENWDGALRDSPRNSAKAVPVARRPKEGTMDARVLESKLVDGKLWFRVEALDPGHCGSAEARPAASGWLPGHTQMGKETVWFYSRGC